MNTLTLEVTSLADGLAAFRQAWSSGKAEDGARIGFATPELLWKVLTAKRWELLRTMTGQGPLALREVARRVERDVKAVHADVHALVDAGIVRRTTDGKFEFPYDAVHVDFMLKAA
ncbi:DNA-binding protein [Azospirillum sp. TSO5]|uniref:HVO_A0114 family putative DNA-binding protein n=1 Tax=Azospirillum sp. TSO5 TaxID=716760 RepID=UPI000D60B497|nr:DNA-binding protein [Azospirillum sp. TSO5]PWC83662.1 DNA-binding protein [Azospirillum sp. TSO5]